MSNKVTKKFVVVYDGDKRVVHEFAVNGYRNKSGLHITDEPRAEIKRFALMYEYVGSYYK